MKYRSKLEKRLHEGPLRKFDYEPLYAQYWREQWYCPDFVLGDLWVEAKGRFRTYADAAKLLAVRECHPDIELVLVFSNPQLPMPGAKRRADGTKLTHSEWADRHNIRWYGEENLDAPFNCTTKSSV